MKISEVSVYAEESNVHSFLSFTEKLKKFRRPFGKITTSVRSTLSSISKTEGRKSVFARHNLVTIIDMADEKNQPAKTDAD